MTLITVRTPGRGLHDITPLVAREVSGDGLVHLFLQHTSASLVISENADPDVLRDMDDWFTRHVPDGDPAYRHADEGPDDMSAHIRAALTARSVSIPVTDGRPALGT
ncbi:MAG: secondary thiamine-phosphate synthase enzyme YjbQ, partial [Myxococcales bacterium]|nr:secondary thiamine-phosphate synthase enzyme YjbQ [Myxococcales bacterium]